MSPERPGSPQDELVQMPKMSVPASPVAGTPIREAQSPMSILLAVAQCAHNQNKTTDDDLTSLSWLQDKDLLKGMNINPSPSNSLNTTPIKYYNHNGLLSDQSPTSDFVDDSSISAAESSSSSVHSPTPLQQITTTTMSNLSNAISNNNNNNPANQRNKHPHNIPYDPLIHTNNKPPYSFSCLIFMAIEDSQQKALPVKEIYAWILDHFPYFKNAPTGWKNSVRHNLSLNKCFQKVEKAPNLGKGSLWTVDPQYKGNLIQALTRSPFHPCSTLDPSLYFNNNNNNNTSNNKNVSGSEKSNSMVRLPNPDLFPFLSRKLANEMDVNGVTAQNGDANDGVSDSESLDAADAAAVMLSLKHGPRLQKRVWQVITTSPSQDHTYSAADNDETLTKKFEKANSLNKNHRTCRKIDFENDLDEDNSLSEEQRRFHEGAVTLLKLAGGDAARRRQSLDLPEAKRFKLQEQSESETEDIEERQEPFKPRLLRAKRKDNAKVVNYNNNNNNEDEWAKSRRELEITSSQDR